MVRARGRDGGLLVELFAPGDDDAWRVADDWVSRCYAHKESALTCVRSRRGVGRQEFYTFIVPRVATQSDAVESAREREIESEGGRAFELRRGGARDLLLVKSSRAATVEAGGVVSDFEWAWLRFDEGETVPREIVLVAGARLAAGGAEVLRGGERVEHLSARRVGAEWRIVDQAGGRDVRLAEIARVGEFENETEREVVGQG